MPTTKGKRPTAMEYLQAQERIQGLENALRLRTEERDAMEQRIEQEVRRNDQLSSDIDAAQRQARNTVRVLRLIEYAGEREEVERQVRQSIHGTIAARRGKVLITAVTLHEYPEILAMARMAPAQNVVVDGSHEGVPDLGSSTNPSRHRS